MTSTAMTPAEYGAMVDKYTICGGVAVAISLAKDVGILDVLCNAEEALTSQEIADKGGLKERYVRELMGALVTGGMVQVDETSTRFHISPEFKPVLKQKAIMARLIPLLGEKYGAIKNCVSKDGPEGVRYSEYPLIFDVLDELQQGSLDMLLDRDFLPSAPGLVDKLGSGIDVAEIGCANGTLLLNLCKRFPNSRFTGSDVVESVLDTARRRGEDRGLTNCDFQILDVCNNSESPTKLYDWIYVRDVIHDLPKPQEAICGIAKMLKPGGIFSLIDYGIEGSMADNVGNTGISFTYSCSTFICIPESYQGQGSAALGPCCGVKLAREMIAKSGLKLLKEHRSELNPFEVTFVCQKADEINPVRQCTE